MSPSGNEQALIAAFSIIPDPHERLSAIVASCSGAGLAGAERRDGELVPGCVSRVWVTGSVEDGRMSLRWDADSPLVKALAGLVCRVYQGTDPGEAAAHTPQILTGLSLDRQLSPTRLKGMENIAQRVRSIAVSKAVDSPIPLAG